MQRSKSYRVTVGQFVVAASFAAMLAASCGSVARRPNSTGGVRCTVTRSECISEAADGTCATFGPPVTFTATACARNNENPSGACDAAYCAQPSGIKYGYPAPCLVSGMEITTTDTGTLPVVGICKTASLSNGTRLALATYTQRSRTCTVNGNRCSALTEVNTPPVSECEDFSHVPAIDFLAPSNDQRDRSVNIISVQKNSPSCPLVGATGSMMSGLTAGNIGSISGAGNNVPVVLRTGFATASQVCPEYGACEQSVDRLVVNLGDVTVAGASVRNVTVVNRGPIVTSGSSGSDDGSRAIPPGAVNLVARGLVNDVETFFIAKSSTPWRLFAMGGNFNLRGALDMIVTNAAGNQVPLTMSFDVDGTPATPKEVACASQSSTARLFGFEDAVNWQATNATLSSVASPTTQGCGALAVGGQGYMPITSAAFSTSGLAPMAALSVDLFIPQNQPNPLWLGALQMYLTCPSGSTFNQYIGQVELTGKPLNQYSALRFQLPPSALSTLNSPLQDCSLGLSLNVNQTTQKWVLDNLRFTP